MAVKIPSMREFALIGAALRVRELEEQLQAILGLFPELKDTAQAPKKRVHRKLTEAEKKVISDRMKASWAKRKRAINKVAS